MSPRINVEEKLFKDQPFIDLMLELKGMEPALGAVVRVWMVAQDYWKVCDNGIPKKIWAEQRLNDAVIRCGLAEERGDFIFVRGSDKHFAWLRQMAEAGKIGGVESGKARREKIEENPKRNEAEGSEAKRSEASSSYSSSLSSSSSDSRSRSKKNIQAPDGFESAFSEYKANFATAQRGGQAAHSRFRAEITSEEKLHDLHQAIRHYAAFLEHPDNSWRHAKTTFANFLGTERSGFFWREWVQAPALTPATAPRANGRGQSRTHMNESVLENVERRLKAEAAQEIHE
jgi:hypothetical protein